VAQFSGNATIPWSRAGLLHLMSPLPREHRSCPCKADDRMKDMPFQVDAHTNSAPLTGHPRRVCAGDSDFDVIWSSALRSPSGAVLQAEIWSCGDQEFTSMRVPTLVAVAMFVDSADWRLNRCIRRRKCRALPNISAISFGCHCRLAQTSENQFTLPCSSCNLQRRQCARKLLMQRTVRTSQPSSMPLRCGDPESRQQALNRPIVNEVSISIASMRGRELLEFPTWLHARRPLPAA
jgi:hypothetical protein